MSDKKVIDLPVKKVDPGQIEARKIIDRKIAILNYWLEDGIPFKTDGQGKILRDDNDNRILEYYPSAQSTFCTWDYSNHSPHFEKKYKEQFGDIRSNARNTLDVYDFKKANSKLSKNELAEKYCNNICWKYSSVGTATALPGIIPGLGTITQVATTGVTISTDLALMLRWMGSMTYGTALIYDRDIESNFNQDFVKVLGLWCGVLKAAEQASKRVGKTIGYSRE